MKARIVTIKQFDNRMKSIATMILKKYKEGPTFTTVSNAFSPSILEIRDGKLIVLDVDKYSQIRKSYLQNLEEKIRRERVTMNKYETVFIVDPSTKESKMKDILKSIEELIKRTGVAIETAEWGKRKLAYMIKDCSEGYYYLIHFNGTKELIKELESTYRKTDEIIKSIVVNQGAC